MVDNILLGIEKADSKVHPYHCPALLPRRRPPSRIKKAVISTLEDLWSREWRESFQGSTTRLFFPSPRCFTQLRSKYPSQQVMQILTGHSLLNSHKFRLKLVSSPSCACTFPCESIQHFIFDCPLYADLRVNFMSACFSSFGNWPPPISSIHKSTQVYNEFCKFISQSYRLSPKHQIVL